MVTQTVVASGAWLAPDAAASYLRMRAAGCPAGITSAGRTYAEQADLYRRWKTGTFKAPSVATPGTSLHETGLALDLPDPAMVWVKAHGAGYGWIAGLVKNEPWHFQYQQARDTHRTPTPAGGFDVATLRTLQKGSTGPDVKAAQILVTAAGYNAGTPDGVAGDKWVTAFKAFQKAHGLTEDAAVGAKTWAHLLGVA